MVFLLAILKAFLLNVQPLKKLDNTKTYSLIITQTIYTNPLSSLLPMVVPLPSSLAPIRSCRVHLKRLQGDAPSVPLPHPPSVFAVLPYSSLKGDAPAQKNENDFLWSIRAGWGSVKLFNPSNRTFSK